MDQSDGLSTVSASSNWRMEPTTAACAVTQGHSGETAAEQNDSAWERAIARTL
jgi:hypothetical protein